MEVDNHETSATDEEEVGAKEDTGNLAESQILSLNDSHEQEIMTASREGENLEPIPSQMVNQSAPKEKSPEAEILNAEANLDEELPPVAEQNQEEPKTPKLELTNNSVSVTPPPKTTRFIVTYTPESLVGTGMKELILALENGKWKWHGDGEKTSVDYETGKITILLSDIRNGGILIATAFSGEEGVDFLGSVTQKIQRAPEGDNPKAESPESKEETPQSTEMGNVYIQYFSFEKGKLALLQGKTESGKTVESQEILQGDIGTRYDTKAVRPQSIIDANGVKWVLNEESTEGQEEGVFGEEAPKVAYYYTRHSEIGSVKIWYVDETGAILRTETAIENQAVENDYDISNKKQAEITVGNKVYTLVKEGVYPIGTVSEDGNLIQSNLPNFIGVDPIKGKIIPGDRTVAFVYKLAGEITDPQEEDPNQEAPLPKTETPQAEDPKQEILSPESKKSQAAPPKQETSAPGSAKSPAVLPKAEGKEGSAPKQETPSSKLENPQPMPQNAKKLPAAGDQDKSLGVVGSLLFMMLAVIGFFTKIHKRLFRG
ncbi:MucBP domain-containing protein [Streptococcus pantholopis]|nr:MucBP domain-containing protein [Streptococcus pantholopis]